MSNKCTPESFYNMLVNENIDFYSGVPDSLLKDFCYFVDDNIDSKNHVIAANEGNALAIGIGYHLATGNIPLIYLQNSGLGNLINPLLSLADPDVYSIPALLLIGWRGEPGVKDEPQHRKQGKVTLELLEVMGIPFSVLDENLEKNEIESIIKKHADSAVKDNQVQALVVRKGFFSKYTSDKEYSPEFKLTREDAIKSIMSKLNGDELIVATTGLPSRELYEHRKFSGVGHSFDFLTVGGMGHANQIGLGLALNLPERQIVCLDGDGSLLMHMGSMALVGTSNLKNVIHIVLNNGAHDSVGGQDTVAFKIDIKGMAKCAGYKNIYSVIAEDEIDSVINDAIKYDGPTFIEVRLRKGWRPEIGRPTTTPLENKQAFMNRIRNISD